MQLNVQLLWSFLFVCAFLPLEGQRIAIWSFENISGVPTLPIPARFEDRDLVVSTSSALEGGNNIGSPDVCSASETWATNFWPIESSRQSSHYMEFSVKTRGGRGREIHFSQLSLIMSASSNDSASDFDVYYSAGGSFQYLGTGSTETSCRSYFFPFEEVTVSSTTLRFRIYPYGQNPAARAATLRIDNVAVWAEAILPIELAEFTGRQDGLSILLNWTTATERQNDYIEIERSLDGERFEVVGRVEGYGDSQTPRHYEWRDLNPVTGYNYYRLIQVDLDGSRNIHPVIAITFVAEVLPKPILFPTLVRDYLELRRPVYTAAIPAEVSVLDSRGHRHRVERVSAAGSIQLDGLSNLPPGPYFVSWKDERGSWILRFFKL